MAFRTSKQTKTLPHILINAGPGTGKTTTMIAGLNMIVNREKPSWTPTSEQEAIWDAMKGHYSSIGFQAFNRSIANEIQERVPNGVKASTFHAFGLKVLRNNGYKLKPDGNNVKYIVKDLQGYKKKDRQSMDDFRLGVTVSRIVSLLKGNLLEATPENVIFIIETYNLEISSKVDMSKLFDLIVRSMKRCLEIEPGKSSYMDFDDMLWLPLKLNLDFNESKFDLLISDESQDLNPIQHELVKKSGSRLICVGDRRQSIYGFRGADSKSMETLKEALSATERGVIELDLQTTFRLPKSGVQNVNGFAPDLRATEDAIDGEIHQDTVSTMTPEAGDLILSRINANIFSLAFSLLRDRKSVRIQGKDFAQQLKKLLESVCDGVNEIPEIQDKLSAYESVERDRLMKRTFPERGIMELEEKMACLYSLTGGCSDLSEMKKVIDELFNEDLPRDKVILLSTIHRAKGMEADNVWFLEPQLVPHKMATTDEQIDQEMNLKFVAETRHKKKLVYVYPSNRDGDRDELEGRYSNSQQPSEDDLKEYSGLCDNPDVPY